MAASDPLKNADESEAKRSWPACYYVVSWNKEIGKERTEDGTDGVPDS